MNMRNTAIAAILLIAMVALPVMACETPPPTCPPGEVWGQMGENCYQVPAVYGPCEYCPHHHEVCSYQYCKEDGTQGSKWNHEYHSGQPMDYKVYDCNYNEGFIKDQCSNHKGKPLITPAHQHCDPIFGCIAVSCPAIPCEEGFHCADGACLPDVCGEDFTCDPGYRCDGNACVANPPEPEASTSSFTPFDESMEVRLCSDLATAPVVVSIDRYNIPYVYLTGHYTSMFDTLEIFTCHGEYLSNGFYNPVVAGMRAYGGMPVVGVSNPMRAIRIRGAKDSLSEVWLPMTLTLRDDRGVVLYSGTTTEQVMDVSIILPQ